MRPFIAGVLALSSAATLAAAQVPTGGEFRVNTHTVDAQRTPDMSFDAAGNFVVVWASRGQDGYGLGIFARRFDARGAALGAEFQVNTHTTLDQTLPRIASDAAGNFAVVWQSEAQDGDGLGVFARRFAADGTPAGPEFQVNTIVTGAQTSPDVAMDGRGGFLVIWNSPDGSSSGVFARRYDSGGQPVGTVFQVNTETNGSQFYPAVAMDQAGSATVTWTSLIEEGSGNGAIIGRRIGSSGAPQGPPFVVNSYTTSGQEAAAVAMGPEGTFVAAWRSYDQDGSGWGIFARIHQGAPLGSDFQVNTSTVGHQDYPSVAMDRLGNFVVAWHDETDGDGRGVFAQRFDRFGARRGAEFRVNTYTTGEQSLPAVASDPNGNFAVTWTSALQDGDDTGVFAQRYGGLRPFALAVDVAGNGVLEPAETAGVIPSWRNLNGGALTFGGSADFTGPGLPYYVTVDASASYGTVADGATVSCSATSDCYVVSTNPPGFRPFPHWDAALNENLTPSTVGQSASWTIHLGESFTDVPTPSPFYRFVETLFHRGVTAGCAFEQYCPLSSTSREQMAVFVLVGREGAAYVPPPCGATPAFADVPPTSPFCRWVEELARRGVVAGCGGGNYCPESPVTREQMAVFVLRTLDPALAPPACGTPVFADVPATSPFCRWIEELARRGIVTGCGGGSYCPVGLVTREQMGVFIGVTFGLTLYGP